MALVTLQRSPTPSAASSSASNSELEAGSEEDRKLNLSLSESFFMVKGAALFLQQGSSPQGQRSLQHPHKHAGDLPQHLQVMINLLRCEDRIKLAVRLESAWADRVRYMVVVYSSGRQDTEENILLGVDFSSKESKSCTIGMVLRLWSDTKIHLDGDGGFSVSTAGRMHIFKPVSVQAMWSALQVLHKACEVARRHNYFPGGVALIWATYYESCISSEQSCINEWNAMQDLESTRPDSPALFVDKPTEGERTERLIKAKLRSIMMSQDLENVTSKEIRNELEKQMNCNLKEFKEFIDNEMLLILGQMDKPSLIFDHLYLGSEWNASNLEELQGSGVDYILNVTREIDNFFPGLFAYHNIRVYDEETTDLLAHWNEAYHFINKAKRNHSKCLVHCKMGVSRSASTVIAYAMKEFGWPLEKAYNYVKQKRSITRPNAGFMRQLSEYEGILDASKQRHNKLWRQHTDSNLRQPMDDPAGPGDFLPETPDGTLESQLPCLEDATQPGSGSPLPCCFRRLSDPLLPSPEDETGSLVHLQDPEREALLEEAALPAEVHRPARQPQQGPGLCEKDVKKKLEFGSPRGRSGSLPQVEETEREEGLGAGSWGRLPTQLDQNLLNSENLNNNNSKRSCPDGTEHDAIFGILNKVKPSYKSCADCVYPTAGGAPEASREQCEDPSAPAICTQPSFLPHITSSPVAHMASRSRVPEKPASGPTEPPPFLPPAGSRRPDASGPGAGAVLEPPTSLLEPSRETPKVLPKSLLLKNSHCDKNPPSTEVVIKEESSPKKDTKPAKDLRLLFSNESEKPTTNSYLMQHQESIIQLQKAGLVRKHTKELERLKSVPADPAPPSRDGPAGRLEASIPEESQDLATLHELGPLILPGQAGSDEKSEAAPASLEGGSLKSPPPFLYRLDHTSSFSKDFLKTICYTPTSSSMSSNLTRSSSSDSIHSVRGKPGLVKQRTQEIETRLRLAGLTVSSPLKRSHSLAKLGSLNFSTEDLSSEADPSTGADSQDATLSESSFLHEPQATQRDPAATSKSSGKPASENLKSPSWMSKS
ncbi:protein phosphatase Slingshot homolog 1 isoform X1 [Piliocolobus tephrosceles]|uniref:Protein phosphatase Slingshot homolog 1 n=3 Tax=Piliocolobus tephrosceles TaxID=591936 RepID=A0A8C9LPD5_9PRIM|nr:protein phosphatase Slingshot homolog 1 isoform X1 [Piliocolobus tephrosceles]XP_023054482.1 protein phosphatase Slingshot homolog 1 isoform X1 [Piliocolobus tephrosceles]